MLLKPWGLLLLRPLAAASWALHCCRKPSRKGCEGVAPSLASAQIVLASTCWLQAGSCCSSWRWNQSSQASSGRMLSTASAHSVLERSCGFMRLLPLLPPLLPPPPPPPASPLLAALGASM